MELGDLRAFLAVAEELSFTRAADRLNVTQPPLTRLISRLEGRLGAPLFERTTRRVRLTAAGRPLVGEAREVLARADAARRRLRDATAARSPWLGVDYTQVALHTALPRLVERLGAISPDRELRLREASTRRQIEALEAAEIDLGLLHLPVRSAHL
jgi:DNA-binding transcriptional LysR family regulator